MNKFSKKGALLFAAAMTVCAFVMAPVASAASWGPVGGTDHVLDSPNFGFTATFPLLGNTISSCTRSSFTAVVVSAADMQIRGASFGGLCTATSAGIGDCTLTTQATGLPWTATARTTSDIQIHGVDINVTFEQPPAGGCSFVGQTLRFTGTLAGGNYTGPGRLDLNNAEGLTSHSPVFGSNAITIRASLTDTNVTSPLTVS